MQFKNDCVDIMHDIFEGVFQCELKCFLQYFVFEKENRTFTLRTLNSRLKTFRYSRHEQRDRPSSISIDKLKSPDNSLGQRAAQSLCFSRIITFLIGDLVPSDSQHWGLLNLLLEIIDIVLCPRLHINMVTYLSAIVAEHNKLFTEVYPDKRLTAKFHNLVHYPACLIKSGPACRYWNMRFEGKHNQLKQFATSFKNVSKTIAWKTQIQQCIMWNCEKKFGKADLGTGDGEVLQVRRLAAASVVCEKLGYDLCDDVYVCRNASFNGTDYYSQDVLVVDMNADGFHQFVVIDEIVIIADTLHFITEDLETLRFDEHYKAYEVQLKPSSMMTCWITTLSP